MRGATQVFSVSQIDSTISIHAPHAGRDAATVGWRSISPRFQSTRPVRGATASDAHTPSQQWHFNPRAPCGARLRLLWLRLLRKVFQSTRPVRARHATKVANLSAIKFQSTRPVRARPSWGRVPSTWIRFQSTRPVRARQQKYTKLFYTLLRQKAIFRQFHAKRRLLKRFSTYKYRNTFLICSANRMGKICTLPLRTTRSLDLPEGMSACSQSARFCFRTFFPSSKTADYPAPDP